MRLPVSEHENCAKPDDMRWCFLMGCILGSAGALMRHWGHPYALWVSIAGGLSMFIAFGIWADGGGRYRGADRETLFALSAPYTSEEHGRDADPAVVTDTGGSPGYGHAGSIDSGGGLEGGGGDAA